jgi:hypothetical protein
LPSADRLNTYDLYWFFTFCVIVRIFFGKIVSISAVG